eukprot:gene2699-biopygen2029
MTPPVFVKCGRLWACLPHLHTCPGLPAAPHQVAEELVAVRLYSLPRLPRGVQHETVVHLQLRRVLRPDAGRTRAARYNSKKRTRAARYNSKKRTRAARYNSKKRTRAGRGPDAGSAVSPSAARRAPRRASGAGAAVR